MEQLKKIIGELQEIRSETKDDVLFSKAIDIYLMQIQEKNKDDRTEKINKPELKLASVKQKMFLEKLGYKGKVDDLTMIEASKLIEELKNKGDEDEQYAY